MYRNFLTAMKDEGVTFIQIGSLLECRYQTVSDTVNGETRKGFHHGDAMMVRNVLLPRYDLGYLLQREKQCVNKHMFDESNYTTVTYVCRWEKKGGYGK